MHAQKIKSVKNQNHIYCHLWCCGNSSLDVAHWNPIYMHVNVRTPSPPPRHCQSQLNQLPKLSTAGRATCLSTPRGVLCAEMLHFRGCFEDSLDATLLPSGPIKYTLLWKWHLINNRVKGQTSWCCRSLYIEICLPNISQIFI